MNPVRFWLLRAVVRVMRALDDLSRRLMDPDAGRCPATGRKHVFALFAHQAVPHCCHCGQVRQAV